MHFGYRNRVHTLLHHRKHSGHIFLQLRAHASMQRHTSTSECSMQLNRVLVVDVLLLHGHSVYKVLSFDHRWLQHGDGVVRHHIHSVSVYPADFIDDAVVDIPTFHGVAR